MPDKKGFPWVKVIAGGATLASGLVLLFTGNPTEGVALVIAGIGVLQGKRIVEKSKKVIKAVKNKPKK